VTDGPVVFVDTETTGLDPYLHEIWEVGLIRGDREYRWFLPVDLGRADPYSLKIGGYHARHPDGDDGPLAVGDRITPVREFARAFAGYTRGMHLVGAVVSFDEERLRRLLRANGATPDWHYHLIDVEALATGYVAAAGAALPLPWKSDDLSRELGIEITEDDRHTALGDARWAKRIYDVVMGSASPAERVAQAAAAQLGSPYVFTRPPTSDDAPQTAPDGSTVTVPTKPGPSRSCWRCDHLYDSVHVRCVWSSTGVDVKRARWLCFQCADDMGYADEWEHA
jgi:hypothetical protein